MSPFQSVRNLQIHIAPEPQLAVAKGIVHDRAQKLNSGQSVLGWRCARASYGALCKRQYQPHNPLHQGLSISRDPLDGIVYVTDSIEWFIRKVLMIMANHNPIITDNSRVNLLTLILP
jgi:hypothetical protein